MDAQPKNARTWRPPWDPSAPPLWILGVPPCQLGVAVVGAGPGLPGGERRRRGLRPIGARGDHGRGWSDDRRLGRWS